MVDSLLIQGCSRICGHADMTAQSFGQFRPKEQGIMFFLKESFTYVRTKFCFLVLSTPFLNARLHPCFVSNYSLQISKFCFLCRLCHFDLGGLISFDLLGQVGPVFGHSYVLKEYSSSFDN